MSMQNEKKQESQKVTTKYDLKKQRKAEAKAKEAKEIAIWRTVGVLFILAIVALILFFPIRNYTRTNKVLFKVAGRDIKQLEYDYYYNAVVGNYFSSYGSYLSYMGLTVDSDFSTVDYSEGMTFADFFQQSTVEQIQQNEGLRKLMEQEGYTYDSEEHYNEVVKSWEESAKENNVPLKSYIKSSFGKYATKKNLKPIIKDAYTIGQYIVKQETELAPDDEAIEAYYKEHKDDYDSVDYYLATKSAVLPSEPTEQADEIPVFAEDGTYTPSEAEVEAAMEETKANAEYILDTIEADGALHEGETSGSVSAVIKSWLFDESRKAGDEEIIESASANMYYIVKFVKRYLSEETTVNARIIITEEDNGAAIIAEYEAGGANLDSFLAVNDKYTTGTAEGALYENLASSEFTGGLKDWLFSADRKEGEVNSFYIDESYTYVVYYVSAGEQVWKANAKSTLLNDILENYLNEAKDSSVVNDPDGFLGNITVNAA